MSTSANNQISILKIWRSFQGWSKFLLPIYCHFRTPVQIINLFFTSLIAIYTIWSSLFNYTLALIMWQRKEFMLYKYSTWIYIHFSIFRISMCDHYIPFDHHFSTMHWHWLCGSEKRLCYISTALEYTFTFLFFTFLCVIILHTKISVRSTPACISEWCQNDVWYHVPITRVYLCQSWSEQGCAS